MRACLTLGGPETKLAEIDSGLKCGPIKSTGWQLKRKA
jgi:hypothetical protein